ncbi:MAG: hypothetical protein LBU27_00345 [Candidatus Peribacteria bacterium]|jgi:hypothetical protein|nr:hypothetical protein [Candidatus Peribacteria bacterium]
MRSIDFSVSIIKNTLDDENFKILSSEKIEEIFVPEFHYAWIRREQDLLFGEVDTFVETARKLADELMGKPIHANIFGTILPYSEKNVEVVKNAFLETQKKLNLVYNT